MQADKGFLNYGALYWLNHSRSGQPSQRHWLIRAKSNYKCKVIREFGRGDALAEVNLSTNARAADPDLPRKMHVRVLSYQIDGFPPQTLLTSLLDPKLYPAQEVVARYHERWELELGYRELKTDILQRKEALRSRKPKGVRQEVWGILLAYNLIRCKMVDVADRVGLPPIRISFKNSLHAVRALAQRIAWEVPPGTLPKSLDLVDEALSTLTLPERRSGRRYPRHVKIKMSKYKRNRGRPDLANDLDSSAKTP